MRNFIRVSIIVAICTSAIRAQEVPGYLGKRIVFKYESALWPMFANPTGPDYEITSSFYEIEDLEFDPGLSMKHMLAADYVYSKSASYGVRLGYISNYYGNVLIPFSSSSNGSFVSDALPARLQEFGTLNSFSLGFGLKKFNEHFAPLGKFFELGVEVHFINYGSLVFLTDELVDPNAEMYQTLERSVEGGTTTNFSLFLGQSTNRIIGDKFVLSYGYELGIALYGYSNASFLLFNNDLFDSGISVDLDQSDEAIQDLMADAANSRVFAQALINFKVSIGILH